MAEQRSYVRMQETQRLCGIPSETVRQWAKEDAAPLVDLAGSMGMAVDRRDLRMMLLRRHLPVPTELEPWPRVLVADDDSEMLRFVDWMVHYAWNDAAVYTAQDGRAAQRMLYEIHPDLLVTDLKMPGSDGENLCRATREDPALAHTKILVITGYDEPASRERLLPEVDAYMVKPFEPKDLRDMAFRLLGPSPGSSTHVEGGLPA